MAGISDNYNLTLPELEDKITDSIPQIAENFKTIDSTMKANEEKINTDIAEAIDAVEAQLSETNKDVDTLDKALTSTKAEWTELFDGAVKMVFGVYGGNGEANRFINLGFTPVAVLVLQNGWSTFFDNSDKNNISGGLALIGYKPKPESAYNTISITDGGFIVNNLINNGVRTNCSDSRYHFIAFKNGEIKVVS